MRLILSDGTVSEVVAVVQTSSHPRGSGRKTKLLSGPVRRRAMATLSNRQQCGPRLPLPPRAIDSVGPNYAEECAAERKKGFIQKRIGCQKRNGPGRDEVSGAAFVFVTRTSGYLPAFCLSSLATTALPSS